MKQIRYDFATHDFKGVARSTDPTDRADASAHKLCDGADCYLERVFREGVLTTGSGA
jgi:hypothetical protein